MLPGSITGVMKQRLRIIDVEVMQSDTPGIKVRDH